ARAETRLGRGHALGLGQFHPPGFGEPRQHAALRGVVLNHEPAPAAHLGRPLPPCGRLVLAEPYGDREMKLRPLSLLTLHPQSAVHEFDQTLADGEAEARPAELARGRAVHLSEGLEELILLLARDADAGVGDGEIDLDVAGLESRARADRDDHLALHRE